MLVDWLIREGKYDTAREYAAVSGTAHLCSTHVFAEAKAIEASLHGRDCTLALAWCEEHRARLTKLKSSLEFKLRLQQFFEVESRAFLVKCVITIAAARQARRKGHCGGARTSSFRAFPRGQYSCIIAQSQFIIHDST